MAKWESKELADLGVLKDLAEAGATAIEAVQGVMTIVQAGGEVAKLFLMGVVNPAALAVKLLAEAIIAQLKNYQESGWFFLYVDPLDASYGMKEPADNFGFEMLTDSEGRVQFYPSTVMNIDKQQGAMFTVVNPLSGKTFEVGDAYQRSLTLTTLGEYYDKKGRDKNHEKFIPPTPKLVSPPKIVAGGYDPATWDGDMQPWDYLPIFDAVKCRTVMADAFDDEGDIPKFEIINKNQTLFAKGSNKPYTKTGGVIAEYDPSAIYKIPLYENGNTALSTSERKVLTKRIKSGKPNYNGDTSLLGTSVFGLAVIVAAQNPQEFIDSIVNVGKLFGPPFKTDTDKLKAAFEKWLTPDQRKITISVDTEYGQFEVDDLIMGDDSGAVGKITGIGPKAGEVDIRPELGAPKPTKMSRKYMSPVYEEGDEDDGVPIDYVLTEDTSVRATNSDGRYLDTEVSFLPIGPGVIRTFLPSEKIFEAKAITREVGGKEQIVYVIKGIEFRNMPKGFGYAPPAGSLPKFGTLLAINALAPASTAPDFISLKADMIPGWSDMFEGLIQMATAVKGFAEDTLAFIIALIEAIEDLIEDFTKLLNALIQLIELLTIGLPNAGIWMLGMESSTGNEGFKNAITSSSNAPDASYKFSCGFCFVGDPVLADLTGKDPLELVFGDILGIEFQPV